VPDRLAFRERGALFLKAHPNEWIPATQFEAIGGRQAWRTRLAECRPARIECDVGDSGAA
jgi:hypothetical protein